jgi:ketosteroid isomerase-like protein
MSNIQTVQQIYAAFGRGDIPAILERVSPDTRWGFNGAQPEQVPYHTEIRGAGELPSFFGKLGESVAFESFEPRTFLDAGRDVVVEVAMRFQMSRTGKPVDQTQLHWWSFDDAGKVSRLIHFEDTAQVVAAAS